MRTKLLLGLLAALIWSCHSTEPNNIIDLSGDWVFAIDSLDRGEEERWFTQFFDETVVLPGSMATNGKGNRVTIQTQWTGGIRDPQWFTDSLYAPYQPQEGDSILFPFWLQPIKEYTGAAWYQRKISIPNNWEGRRTILNLERCHWESTVWIDDQEVGTRNSLSTAHLYDLTLYLKAGEEPTLSIRIDNRVKIDIGENSHSISDHTQSNWNGIVGDIFLENQSPIYFSDLQLYPNASTQTVTVKGSIAHPSSQVSTLQLTAKMNGVNFNQPLNEQTFSLEANEENTEFEFEYTLSEEVRPWDEFQPNLYEISLSIEGGDERTEVIGFRTIAVKNRQFLINGRPSFLRGTLECAIFPETGYPPTEVDVWRKILKTIQDHGLNHMRFHSWCPPEAAFRAADEMGVYLQVEAASWANQSTTLGDGNPVDQFVLNESERIVKTYGNHPSFIMFAYGNEPGGERYPEFLAEYVSVWKEKDDRRIYTSAAGWPAIDENEFHVVPEPRIQAWGQGLNSIINGQPPSTDYDFSENLPDDTIAVVSHEIGQWCVYPDFKEIERYTGVLKANNFELFRKSLNAHKLGDLAEDFLMASGKLQALCYKADIEGALRTPDQAGFQLLDLHDFPGQGTALVGVLNPFWEEKGYISPEEYSRFSNSTVPLVRLEKRVFEEGEKMEAKVEIAHFGQMPLQNVTPTWQIKDAEGNTVAAGQLETQTIPLSNAISLGEVSHSFKEQNRPRMLTLEVIVGNFSNSWDLWVYPSSPAQVSSDDILHVSTLDTRTLDYLKAGGSVLWSLGKGQVAEGKGGEVGVGFSSIFWNTAWTDQQKPHTLGILCDPEHPALQQFPTEFHANWQWWDAMSHSDVVNLNELSDEIQPIVRVIDDWVTNRSLGLLFEVKVGNGKLLISGVDLKNDLTRRLEARQLLRSIINYMESNYFNPTISLREEQLTSIVKPQS